MYPRLTKTASTEKQSSLKDKQSSPTTHELEWIFSRSYHLLRILLQRSQTKQLEQLLETMQEV